MGYKFNPFTGNLDAVVDSADQVSFDDSSTDITAENVQEAIEELDTAVTGSSTNGYEFQNYENTGTYVYVGYEETGGAWYIYRRTLSTNAREYASGASSYSTNWTSRGSLSYA